MSILLWERTVTNFSLMVQKMAPKSTHKLYHHVVIATRGGSIAAIGVNHNNTHAEVACLNQIWPNKRKGLKIWSYRLRRDGQMGMAKPCTECQEYLRENGIKVVYYTNRNGQIERMRT